MVDRSENTKSLTAYILVDHDPLGIETAHKIMTSLKQEGVTPLRILTFSRRRLNLTSYGKKPHIENHRVPDLVSSGKNAVDIALTVQAMNLRHDEVDLFILIVSDSDYSPLIVDLQKNGKEVWVLGNQDTPECVRYIADKFEYRSHTGDVLDPPKIPPVSILIKAISKVSKEHKIEQTGDIVWKRTTDVAHVLKKRFGHIYDCNSQNIYIFFRSHSDWFSTYKIKKNRYVRLKKSK